MDSNMDKIRFFTELIQLTGAFLYIVAALREMKFLGYHMFIENLVSELKFSMIALRYRHSTIHWMMRIDAPIFTIKSFQLPHSNS